MEERTEQNIKKENGKAFIRFIIILFIATIFGGAIGITTQIFQEKVSIFLKIGLTQFIESISFYGICVCSILLSGASLVIYFRCKSQLKKKEMDEDELLDRVELQLNYPILFTNICMILDFLFFAGGIADISNSRQVGMTLVAFLISIAVIVLIQQKTIDLLRVLNPEKKGSVYDMNFSHKWEESSDEAEKLIIYKASYISFRYTTMSCIGIWLVLMIGSNVTDIGILPIACVVVIWMVQTVSYCIASMRITKTKQGKKNS